MHHHTHAVIACVRLLLHVGLQLVLITAVILGALDMVLAVRCRSSVVTEFDGDVIGARELVF